jgi:enoyl-CoA hydratase/carnithine racemase
VGFRGSPAFTGEWRHFDFDVTDRVATIRLDRTEALNALTLDSYADLRDLFAELPHAGVADVIVLTGNGRAFCSGGDVRDIIAELLEADPRKVLDFTRMSSDVVGNMRRCELPIIASVNGLAVGGGAMLALAADFRIVSTEGSLHFPFTKLGIAGADMGAIYLLSRTVGLARTTEILMLGEPLSPADLDRLGLANSVVEPGELAAATADLAQRLVEGPTFAYAATKRAITSELDMDLTAALEHEATLQALVMGGEDFGEFHRAYAEKRPPRWTNRR